MFGFLVSQLPSDTQLTQERRTSMDENWKGYSKMEMDIDQETSRRAGRDKFQVKRSFLLLVSGTFILLLLLVMICASFGYQERKFEELTSVLKNLSSVNSMNSELKVKVENTGTELEKVLTQLKSWSQTSHVNMTVIRPHEQLDSGDQAKKLSELERLINNLGSSLESLFSKLDTKVQETAVQQDGHYSQLKNDLQSVRSSVTELASRLQDVGAQVQKLSVNPTVTNSLESSLGSFSSKLETKVQDVATQQDGHYTQLKTDLQNLKTSVTELASKFQGLGDQEQKLSEIKNLINNLDSSLASVSTKLDTSIQDSGAQVQKISEIETLMNNLSSSMQSFSSKLETKDTVTKKDEHYTELKKDLLTLKSSVSELHSKLQAVEEKMLAALADVIIQNTSLISEFKCRPGWRLFFSMCYFVSANRLNWHEARDYCQSQDASLLKLETTRDWSFVTSEIIPDNYWIGLTDEITGEWRWHDGTHFDIIKDQWRPGQPDDWTEHGLGEEGEDCGHIVSSGKLNDLHCSVKMKYICRRRSTNPF